MTGFFVSAQGWVWRLLRDERGQTVTEYAILMGTLAVGSVFWILMLKGPLGDLFLEAAQSMFGPPEPPPAPTP